MATIPITTEMNERRRTFFRLALGQNQGYLCLAYKPQNGKAKAFGETFFHWPQQEEEVLEFINEHLVGYHLWFCPQLLAEPKRQKGSVETTPSAWADLDSCDPSNLDVEPSIVIESSPDRFQALWIFDRQVDPDDAEDLSRRIAYKHADQGADRSGWDLTQLLRIPFTYNYKYPDAPPIKIIEVSAAKYRLDDFKEDYPQVSGYEYVDLPQPETDGLDADALLQKKRLSVNPHIWKFYQEVPDEHSWSERLWRLHMLLFEAGFTREEAFVIAREAKCNKYARDGRPDKLLWKEVCRAFAKHEQNLSAVLPTTRPDDPLVTDEERRQIESEDTFIERYIQWAKGLGDAAPQYHQAGAFIALSSLLAGTVRLPTSYGTIVPNLWFMILADTTLTRKTTAMDLSMDLVMEVDPESVLATDGSIEGLLTSLSTRPGRPSVFLRDEFTGLLEQITKRDYYAGMPELLTKLYDGKFQKRVLRKETLEVKDPCLIVFAGGIKNKVTSLLTFEHVSSGFMPRFVFITAEADVTKLKPIGPPTGLNLGNREAIKNELMDLSKHYKAVQTATVDLGGGKLATIEQTVKYDARLTDDAWVRYNKIEADMVEAGVSAQMPEIMTPVYDRLSKSILKASVLLAASRQRSEEVVVEESDIVRAAAYGESWRSYAREVMNQVGKGGAEKLLDNIYRAVKRQPGIGRSTLMQNYHLSARDADQAFMTLEQRGLVIRQKQGRSETLHPAITV